MHPEEQADSPFKDPHSFTILAIVFELLVLLPVAWGIQSLWVQEPLEVPTFNLTTIGQGLLATLPLLIFLVALTWGPLKNLPMFKEIHDKLDNGFGHTLARLEIWQIILISLAAGIGEEILFRGVLQPRITIWATAIIFGLLHSITLTYTIIAALLGYYLGWVYEITGKNIGVPIFAHALYDAIALWVFRIEFRKNHPAPETSEEVSPESPDPEE